MKTNSILSAVMMGLFSATFAQAATMSVQCAVNKTEKGNFPNWSLQSDCKDCYWTMDEFVVNKDGSTQSFPHSTGPKAEQDALGKFNNGTAMDSVAAYDSNIKLMIFSDPQVCQGYKENCQPVANSFVIVEDFTTGECNVVPK